MLGFRLVDRKHCYYGAFRNHENKIISLREFFFSKLDKSTMTGNCWVFKFLRRNADGKHLPDEFSE